MNRNILLVFVVALIAAISAQDPTDGPEPTSEPPVSPSTANPGAAYGSFCNGFLYQCNRYSNTVACLQRRPETTTTPAPPTSEDPLTSLFQGKMVTDEPEPGREVCETGITVDLGKCQCSRNCKNGIYVEDGEFDQEREICVGLVDSTCSLLVPNCTKNAKCNFLTSKCACDAGYVADGERRCQPSQ